MADLQPELFAQLSQAQQAVGFLIGELRLRTKTEKQFQAIIQRSPAAMGMQLEAMLQMGGSSVVEVIQELGRAAKRGLRQRGRR